MFVSFQGQSWLIDRGGCNQTYQTLTSCRSLTDKPSAPHSEAPTQILVFKAQAFRIGRACHRTNAVRPCEEYTERSAASPRYIDASTAHLDWRAPFEKFILFLRCHVSLRPSVARSTAYQERWARSSHINLIPARRLNFVSSKSATRLTISHSFTLV